MVQSGAQSHLFERLDCDAPSLLLTDLPVDQGQFYIADRIQVGDQIEALKDKADLFVTDI